MMTTGVVAVHHFAQRQQHGQSIQSAVTTTAALAATRKREHVYSSKS